MNPKVSSHLFAATLAALSISLSTQSFASGFALIENSASGQGNAFAGAAAIAEDASTVWFNPAGMMKLEGNQIVTVGHFIKPDASFSNNGSTTAAGAALTGGNDDGGKNALVANGYWVTDINHQMKFGLGVTTPFGLATEYDDTWVGRYHGIETDLRTININPNIAYRVNDQLSVAAGINMLFADVILTNAIDFGTLLGLPQSDDGFADLEADNFSSPDFGINFGLLYELNDNTQIGVAYRSEIKIKVDGDAVFSGGSAAKTISAATGQFVATGLVGEITLPQSLSLSVAHDINEFKLLADITWTGWSSFDELRIKFDNALQADGLTTEDWDDVFRYSIGVDWQYSQKITLRSGIAYDETPVPSAERRTPRVPGNSRTWLSFGGTYVIDDEFTIDIGYSHLFISDTKINNTFESSQAALAATLKGTYKASVDILSAQLRWNY
jgi:long-chain fatty acid transport protein